MSDYLSKLKTKKQATKVLPKLPKVQKDHTEVLPKLPKVPFGSKGSTQVGHFSEINFSGLPDDLFQAPAAWAPSANGQGTHPDTCPACGENSWWKKNEPNAKWICGRCHPPVSGLDVVYER